MAKAKPKQAISFESIREELWESVQRVKSGNMEPATASVIARNLNGIMKCVKLQMDLMMMSGEKPKAQTLFGITINHTPELQQSK